MLLKKLFSFLIYKKLKSESTAPPFMQCNRNTKEYSYALLFCYNFEKKKIIFFNGHSFRNRHLHATTPTTITTNAKKTKNPAEAIHSERKTSAIRNVMKCWYSVNLF